MIVEISAKSKIILLKREKKVGELRRGEIVFYSKHLKSIRYILLYPYFSGMKYRDEYESKNLKEVQSEEREKE